MAQKTDISVVINGKVYTLSGFEGEEYLQNAVDGILRSIKDGSLMSKKLFETIGFETEHCPDYECVA